MRINDQIKHLAIDDKEAEIRWLVGGKISLAVRVINFRLTKKKLCLKEGNKKVVKVDFASIEPV